MTRYGPAQSYSTPSLRRGVVGKHRSIQLDRRSSGNVDRTASRSSGIFGESVAKSSQKNVCVAWFSGQRRRDTEVNCAARAGRIRCERTESNRKSAERWARLHRDRAPANAGRIIFEFCRSD
jgi:hypothetical protein